MAKHISKHLQQAQKLLEEQKGKSISAQERETKAIDLARLMLKEALATQTFKERQNQKQIARMMQDPRGKAFTMMMTDECFRSRRSKRIADQLIYLMHRFGIPRYLSWTKRFQLWLFKLFGKLFFFILTPVAKMALRQTTSQVILPGEKSPLKKHMAKRRQEGVRLNLNYLGEAILGEQEAVHRLNVYLKSLEHDDVEYVSIKISTIFSQINVLAWEDNIKILSERLRRLYRKSREKPFRRADGTEIVKFVNLDMEEYRDLHLTKELFKRVLDEKEFLDYSAGIVLQAYIPDSYSIQKELTEWALKRKAQGGAPVKIRIVKGANLAMEQVEASLHHWPQTPYKHKSETDANYKRMVLYALQKDHASAVHIGIASHNLFDIAFAMIVKEENTLGDEITFEMLEGMADHIRRVVQKLSGVILLYCPVATKEDFQSAIAYLIRRLDENTGPENFLRHSFGLKPGTSAWEEQAGLFGKACGAIEAVSANPRRTQNRFEEPKKLDLHTPYIPEADTDFYLPQNQQWVHEVIDDWQKKNIEDIPLVIEGQTLMRDDKGEGVEPSFPGKPLYRYALASWEDIDRALKCAKAHESKWSSLSSHDRGASLAAVAHQMRKKRGELIGVMMKDGGKSVLEVEAEISEAIDFAEYYLRSRLELDQMQEIAFSPLGTILVTPPWNFPISIPAGGILAALAAGNCVLFKPAPEAVLSGWVLVNLFWEAGIPKEVLQFLNCEDEPIGSRLIKDQRVNGVILTGGTPTARLFMKMRPDLHLCAETGGKNAIILTGMCDRDLAIKDLVHSAFGHSGQKCSAASLAILEAELYDDPKFLQQLKDAVESLPVGICWHTNSKVIPLIREPNEALKRGLTTLDKGEKWLVEPRQDPNNPNLWSPGVKLGVKENSFMHQTELFGPVLGLMRAKNLAEALRFANGTAYGLTSGIHTLDQREINYWLKHIEAGNCYINRTITGAIVERQPFGGCKASCFGHGSKAGGPNYLIQFMHKKQIALPQEKEPVSMVLNALTGFLNQVELSAEELGTWFVSCANYTYWGKYFSTDHDPQKLVGQDNFLRYVPRKKMAFRIQPQDKPLDIFRILAACFVTKTNLEVSFDPNNCPLNIDGHWQQHLNFVTYKEENREAFIERLKNNAFDRVRLASPASTDMQEAASLNALYLNDEPVLATGRLELLHYLREVAISIDYHRYGNLGTRETEQRSPIL